MEALAVVKLTLADLDARRAAHPEARYELIEGELIEMPSPNTEHQHLVGLLLTYLNLYLFQHPLGYAMAEIDVVLSPELVLRPDVAYFSRERLPKIIKTRPTFAPDIAIEVLSPSNTLEEMTRKIGLYFAHGSGEVWLISPENRQAVTYQRGEGATRLMQIYEAEEVLTSPLLPGFSLRVGEVFPPT